MSVINRFDGQSVRHIDQTGYDDAVAALESINDLDLITYETADCDGLLSRYTLLDEVRESHLDLLKAQEELHALDQSLRMAHLNASLKLKDTQRTISLQEDNQALTEQVFDLAQKNYNLGVASLSDVLNASQSLVQAQMSYASALGDYMKAFIDLKKSRGEIRDLME